MRLSRDSLALYLITDERWLAGRTLVDVVGQALQAGVTMVQLRQKGLDSAALADRAKPLVALCKQFGVPFVVNDDVEAAYLCGADGVHIGQSDGSVAQARQRLGERAIVGVSVGNAQQARTAQADGADYVGVGAVFATGSKDNADSVPLAELRGICSQLDIPVVAIGGITQANVGQLADSGACGISVISAILAAEDIAMATRGLLAEVEKWS